MIKIWNNLFLDADPDPQINSLLTDRALAGHPLTLGGHPLGHPVLHASHNSISAATVAARNPHSGLPFPHPVLHPTLPIPSIQPTLQSLVRIKSFKYFLPFYFENTHFLHCPHFRTRTRSRILSHFRTRTRSRILSSL